MYIGHNDLNGFNSYYMYINCPVGYKLYWSNRYPDAQLDDMSLGLMIMQS